MDTGLPEVVCKGKPGALCTLAAIRVSLLGSSTCKLHEQAHLLNVGNTSTWVLNLRAGQARIATEAAFSTYILKCNKSVLFQMIWVLGYNQMN